MKKKYCAAPWRGLHINFRGDVKTCCAGNPNMLGNLNTQTIEQVLQNKNLIEIRNTIKGGKLHPEYCHNCIQSERYGSSERDWHNNLNENFNCQVAGLKDYAPALIDIRWNNTCNLACNYCDPYSSTRWANIMKEKFNEDIKPYYNQVVAYISKNKKTIKEVALVGGEPLLMKENIDLLDAIDDHVLVTLITNLSVDFEKNLVVKKLLGKTRVGWSMSFDNIGDKFEYVRYGAKWNQMNKNVSCVSDKINNNSHHGGIHAVFNLYNCTRLCELKEYADSKNLNILWQTLYQPDVLDPLRHNEKVKELVLAEIEKLQNNFVLNSQEESFMRNVYSTFENSISTNIIGKQFKDFTYKMENQYHPKSKKFADLWPELYRVI